MKVVTFIAGNEEIPAHRVILSSSSCYFRTLFGSPKWRESGNTKVHVDSSVCSGSLFKTLVEFAYTQQLTVNEETVSDLMVAANFYSFLEVVKNALSSCRNV